MKTVVFPPGITASRTARLALMTLALSLVVLPAGQARSRRPTSGGKPRVAQGTKKPVSKRSRPRRRRRRLPRIRVKRDVVAGGAHWRIATRKRVMHVWRPPGYRRKRAGIVVFVHGYHITADRTWRGQRLADQFRASKQNALFITVDGPTNKYEKVKFHALGKVLRTVSRHTRLRLPRGHIVVMGHSAGFRTVVQWLDYRFVDHVILLDALYARANAFHGWLNHPRYKRWRRLILVGKDTVPQCRRFLKRYRRTARRRNIPTEYSQFTRRERGARLLYMKSQYKHAALVYNRKVIPLLLRLSRLKRVR